MNSEHQIVLILGNGYRNSMNWALIIVVVQFIGQSLINHLSASGRFNYITKELLDASFFCGTYSKSKELLFEPCREHTYRGWYENCFVFFLVVTPSPFLKERDRVRVS